MNHWKIVKSIWQKVEAKNPVGTLNQHSSVPDNNKFPLKYYTARSHVSVGINPGGCTQYRIVSQNYSTACQGVITAGAKFLNFNTDVERYNAWQSYLTKFARFCICMDESTKLAPYMGNYTQPWDDQRFYEYFGLTQPEIQLIETVIK